MLVPRVLVIILISFLLISCGRKTAPKYPGGQTLPDYNKIVEGD